MARIARVVVPGLPHHVVQRGVRSMRVFFSDGDREEYLALLAASGERFGLEFWAWCLMSNHVHFMVVPRREDALSKGMGDAHRRYTRMVNFRQKLRGHLFQERFHSYPVQRDGHAVAVGRYVETNPVRAGLVRKAEEWPWSSAGFNAGRKRRDPLVSGRRLAELASPWGRVLGEVEGEAERRRVELHLGTGRPLGGKRWVRGLEGRTGRRLLAGPAGWPKGRPRKKRRGAL